MHNKISNYKLVSWCAGREELNTAPNVYVRVEGIKIIKCDVG